MMIPKRNCLVVLGHNVALMVSEVIGVITQKNKDRNCINEK